MVLIKIGKDSKNGKKGRQGEGNEIKHVPVGFVPLHCFCISLPFPPSSSRTLSFSCDSEFSDKKQSRVALGEVALFTVPVSIRLYINVKQR